MPSRTRDFPIAPVTAGAWSVWASDTPSDCTTGDGAAETETTDFPGPSTPANPAKFAPVRALLCAGIARPNHAISGVAPDRTVPAPSERADASPIGGNVVFGPSPAVITGVSACGASARRAVPNHRIGLSVPSLHAHVPRVAAVRLAAGQDSDAADSPNGFGVHTASPAPGETTGTADGPRHHKHRSVFTPRTGGTPAEHSMSPPRRADTRDARQPAGTDSILTLVNTAARDSPTRAAGAVDSTETASMSGEASASPLRCMIETNPMDELRPGPEMTHA